MLHIGLMFAEWCHLESWALMIAKGDFPGSQTTESYIPTSQAHLLSLAGQSPLNGHLPGPLLKTPILAYKGPQRPSWRTRIPLEYLSSLKLLLPSPLPGSL